MSQVQKINNKKKTKASAKSKIKLEIAEEG